MSEKSHKSGDLGLAFVGSSPSEAEIVRSLLEDAGLFAVVPDQNSPLPLVDLNPVDGEYRASGCEVLVALKNVEKAKTVIEEARAQGHLTDEAEGDLDYGEEDDEEEEDEEDDDDDAEEEEVKDDEDEK
jgi:hypothetical protein